MRLSALSPLGFCLGLLAAFHAAVWLLPRPVSRGGQPAPVIARVPSLQLAADGRRVDAAALRKSILRLPPVRLLRQSSNSLRLVFGQRPPWMFLGHERRGRPMFFLANEIPLARGLTPEQKESTEIAARVIADLQQRFRQEQWKLVVIPVPSKLSIYREHVRWPIREANRFSWAPLEADRSDEVLDLLFARLKSAGVAAVDLRAPFRALATATEGLESYPPAESHWSARGVEIVADLAAAALREQGLEVGLAGARKERFKLRPDFAEGLDTLPVFPAEAARSAVWVEDLERGAKPPVTTESARAVVAVTGTSYTGQYSWLGDAGLVAALDRRLPNAFVRSYAEAGRGSLQTARTFIAEKTALLDELQRAGFRGVAPGQKYLVWEFPMRDLAGFREPIEWKSSGDHPLVRRSPEKGPQMQFGAGFYGEERHDTGTHFRWARRKAEMILRAGKAGPHRLVLRPITAFTSVPTRLSLSLAGRAVGEVVFETCDFLAAPARTVEVTLAEGENRLTLETDREETVFGSTDPRTPGFGLLLPMQLERVGP